jgi:hypothetical protein
MRMKVSTSSRKNAWTTPIRGTLAIASAVQGLGEERGGGGRQRLRGGGG